MVEAIIQLVIMLAILYGCVFHSSGTTLAYVLCAAWMLTIMGFFLKKKTILSNFRYHRFCSNPTSHMFPSTFGVLSYRFPGSWSVQNRLSMDLSMKNMNFRGKNYRCQTGDSRIKFLMQINGSRCSVGAQRTTGYQIHQKCSENIISGRVNAFQTIPGPLEVEIDENRLMFYILYKSFKWYYFPKILAIISLT